MSSRQAQSVNRAACVGPCGRQNRVRISEGHALLFPGVRWESRQSLRSAGEGAVGKLKNRIAIARHHPTNLGKRYRVRTARQVRRRRNSQGCHPASRSWPRPSAEIDLCRGAAKYEAVDRTLRDVTIRCHRLRGTRPYRAGGNDHRDDIDRSIVPGSATGRVDADVSACPYLW